MSIEQLLRPNIRTMKAYSSARDEADSGGKLQLDANENPFDSGLNRYPDPYQKVLKKKIADSFGLQFGNLVLGNGSDELIDLAIRAFCRPGVDNVVGLKPSYGMYQVCCALNDVAYKEVELNDSFELQADKVLEQVDERTRLIFLCSPNNPTGNLLNPDEIRKILGAFGGITIIDEAYIDFSEQPSYTKQITEGSKLIVLQTFSKAFGMAAIRLGMGWMSEELVAVFNKIKPPYNVSELTQQAALSRLNELQRVKIQIQEIIENREMLIQELKQFQTVIEVFPTQANFVLVKVDNARAVFDFLLENGIVVRDRSNQHGCNGCLRITIGTKEEVTSIINAFKKYEKSTVY